ncbi:MAG: TIGR00730 family Rossman fold protein [Planctomycetota bacterium]
MTPPNRTTGIERQAVMKAVCVYCGSSSGDDPRFVAAAREVGRRLAASERTTVFGGGRVGLMGALADAALEAGGEVIGVIPQNLMEAEVGHTGLTKLHVVESMHERKALMADLSDGFLTLPGGIGTMEEFFETWTWGQLGLHAKPYGLLNIEGFYDPLIQLIDGMVARRFLKAEQASALHVGEDAGELLDRMAAYRVEPMPKWLDQPGA